MKLKMTFLVLFLTLLFDSAFGGARIYGGYSKDIKEAPYMAHLTIPETNPVRWIFCGASILRKNMILTAAHCTTNEKTGEVYEASRYIVYSGTSYFRSGVSHKVKNVYVHPKYMGGGKYKFHHDIALLELADNIELNEKSQLVNLALKNDTTPSGIDGVVSGWGTNPDNPDTDHLYQVHLNVISAESCYHNSGNKLEIEEFDKHEFCAEGKNKNFCSGDSGGPFIDTTTNRQIGVVSYGTGSCTQPEPSVFCRVTDNLDFIENVIEKTKTARCRGA